MSFHTVCIVQIRTIMDYGLTEDQHFHTTTCKSSTLVMEATKLALVALSVLLHVQPECSLEQLQLIHIQYIIT